ncbi:2148_t:CDS:2 [Paraglomus brasilianum]|uniref:2148_t:CDS:1 n=1 Tax=Paraglomus brasilianum TaxID=144538 RepID=A0A9N9FEY9_9GLOM|nr:2148_t:CDS:2 [Paraglomus brasilianum]
MKNEKTKEAVATPVPQAQKAEIATVESPRKLTRGIIFIYLSGIGIIGISLYLQRDAINPWSEEGGDINVFIALALQAVLVFKLCLAGSVTPADYIIRATSEAKQLLKKTGSEIKDYSNRIAQTVKTRNRRCWEWVIFSSVSLFGSYFMMWREEDESMILTTVKVGGILFVIWLGRKIIYSFYTLKHRGQVKKLQSLQKQAVSKFEEFQKMACLSETAGVISEFKVAMSPGTAPQPVQANHRPQSSGKPTGTNPSSTQTKSLNLGKPGVPVRVPSPVQNEGESVGWFTKLAAAVIGINLEEDSEDDRSNEDEIVRKENGEKEVSENIEKKEEEKEVLQ